MNPSKYKKYAAELFGSFLLMVMGAGAIAVDARGGNLGPVGVSLAFGLAVLTVVYAIGHISGAHINPAVTMGFVAAKKMLPREAVPYILSQLTGAVIGVAVVKVLMNPTLSGSAVTVPAGAEWQSLLLEFFMTFILMFVIQGVAHDNRAEGVMAGVAIGAVVVCVSLVAGPVSGGSVNPARSFAPALLDGDFSHHWVYWVGPILGAMAGALFYEFVRCPGGHEGEGQGCC